MQGWYKRLVDILVVTCSSQAPILRTNTAPRTRQCAHSYSFQATRLPVLV